MSTHSTSRVPPSLRKSPPREELFGVAFSTPLGLLAAVASPSGIRRITFDVDALVDVRQVDNPPLAALKVWLDAYLAKRFEDLGEVPLDLVGTPLDLEIWSTLRNIRVGRTVSYGDIAAKVGRTGQARPIGAAVGRNPALLLVPCHRAVAASGALTGYSGGIQRKAWLLRHEGVLLL